LGREWGGEGDSHGDGKRKSNQDAWEGGNPPFEGLHKKNEGRVALEVKLSQVQESIPGDLKLRVELVPL